MSDNSSLSHLAAMARPSWLGTVARNRHGHAIEQASRRWRGGHDLCTASSCSRMNSSFSWITEASFFLAASAFRRATTLCFRPSVSSAARFSASVARDDASSSAFEASA